MARKSSGKAASNGVVAYGLDESGNLMPLSASSVPSQLAFMSQTRKVSFKGSIVGSTGGAIDVFLLGAGEDKGVFIHGFQLAVTDDDDGYHPMGHSLSSGMWDRSYFPDLIFEVGGDVFDFGDGYMGDLVQATNSQPAVLSGIVAAPNVSPLRWVGGFLPVNKFIGRYVEGVNGVKVSSSAGGAGFLRFNVVYSLQDITV